MKRSQRPQRRTVAVWAVVYPAVMPLFGVCIVCMVCSLPVSVVFPSCACWGPVYDTYGFGYSQLPCAGFQRQDIMMLLHPTMPKRGVSHGVSVEFCGVSNHRQVNKQLLRVGAQPTLQPFALVLMPAALCARPSVASCCRCDD